MLIVLLISLSCCAPVKSTIKETKIDCTSEKASQSLKEIDLLHFELAAMRDSIEGHVSACRGCLSELKDTLNRYFAQSLKEIESASLKSCGGETIYVLRCIPATPELRALLKKKLAEKKQRQFELIAYETKLLLRLDEMISKSNFNQEAHKEFFELLRPYLVNISHGVNESICRQMESSNRSAKMLLRNKKLIITALNKLRSSVCIK